MNECLYTPGFCDQCGVRMTKDSIKTHNCVVNFKMVLQELKERGKLSDEVANFKLVSDEKNLMKKNELQTNEIEELK